MDHAEARITKVQEYAQEIDKSLRKFKRQYRDHLKKKAAGSYVSAVISIVTFGMGSGIVTAMNDGILAAFNKIVDFSDNAEVNGAFKEYHGLFMDKVDDKLDDWAEKPLKDAVKDDDSSALPAMAMIKVCTLFNASVPHSTTSTPLSTPALPPPPPPAAPDNLGNETETFAKLKEFLDLGEDEKEIPVDDDFMCAFEGLFKINFDILGSDTEKYCRRLVDRNSKGKIKLLHWRVFYQTWLQSGQSMAEYLKSGSA
uniref:Uncharacterized protein n=1 Tax=Aureoumbra lagunensis TaxID=44058 RepID=A0A7S3JZH0_9STRA